MLVRATAIATDRSNAIGTVELQCTPHGLVIVYLGVGAFSEGYAPGALTMGTRVTVPWSEVYEARVEGDQLFLSLEPARTPHHLLTLVNFSTGDSTHPKEDTRQRLMIWIGAVGAASVATLVSALTVPRVAPHAGASAALTIGGLSALAILAVGFLADRRVGAPTLAGDAAREALAADLSHYLPTLVRLARAPEPKPKPLALPDLAGFLPRTTAAIAITLTAGLLGVVLTARWLLSTSGDGRRVAQVSEPVRDDGPMLEPQAPVETEPASAPAPPPPASADKKSEPEEPAEPAGPQASASGHCSCPRADSVLWRDPIPKLSVLVLDKKLVSGPEKKRLELNIAAVNNGDKDLRELSMMVSFIEQDPPPSNRRTAVSHRAVFYEGPLSPGQAIKWNVEARGSDFEVDVPIEGDIGPGEMARRPPT